jgi:hypothetical protein
MEASPQSMQMLLIQLFSQMEAPPQHVTHEMYWLRRGRVQSPGDFSATYTDATQRRSVGRPETGALGVEAVGMGGCA